MGMFSRNDMPIIPALPPGNGKSFIDLSLAINRTNGSLAQSPIELFLLKSGTVASVFVTEKGQLVCESGRVKIVDDAAGRDPHMRRESLDWNGVDRINVRRRFDIESTGLYDVILAQCPTNSKEPHMLKMTGTMTIMNPYGHLYGEDSGSLPYFAINTVIYATVSLWWAFRLVKFRRDSLILQAWISGVLLLCIMESIMLFTDRFVENLAGEKFSLIMSLTILASLARRTVSRMLIVIVSQGFGSIKTTLDTPWILIFYGLFYFIASGVHEIAIMLFQSRVIDPLLVLFSMAPSTVLDGFLVAWVLSSLAATIKELGERKQDKKLELYQRLLFLIVGYICCSMIVLALQSPFISTGLYISLFYLFWVFDAVWHLLFMIVFLAIMLLWKPSKDNRLYAYEQIADYGLNDMEFSLGYDSEDDVDVEMEIVFSHDDDVEAEFTGQDFETPLSHGEHDNVHSISDTPDH